MKIINGFIIDNLKTWHNLNLVTSIDMRWEKDDDHLPGFNYIPYITTEDNEFDLSDGFDTPKEAEERMLKGYSNI